MRTFSVALRVLATCLTAAPTLEGSDDFPTLGDHRIVLQTKWGDIELGLYEKIAPQTSKHILRLVELGAYNSNSFFRLEAGFVTQMEEVTEGRQVPLNPLQLAEASKTVPFETDPSSTLKHLVGSVSMVHPGDAPDGGTSSFCIILGEASHLDGKYAVIGKVTSGWRALKKIEKIPSSQDKEGSGFYYPKERITILSSFIYKPSTFPQPADVFTIDETPPYLAAVQQVPSLYIAMGVLGVCMLVFSRVLPANQASGLHKDQNV